MTLVECVRLVRDQGNLKDVLVRDAYEKYVKARTMTEDNPDGKWRSRKVPKAPKALAPMVKERGHQWLKWTKGEDLNQYWAKGHPRTRRNKFVAVAG